jgi:hypothetical protein
MVAVMKKGMVMGTRRYSQYRFMLMLSITLGFVFCVLSSDVHAGGVHFGFGVDVPIPGPGYGPPVSVYPPVVVERTPPPLPIVVDRRPAPAPVVVEQAPPPPPVVIRRPAPAVVYEEPPVVVERRSTVYYYSQPYQYRTQHVETEREYYRQKTRTWEDDDPY